MSTYTETLRIEGTTNHDPYEILLGCPPGIEIDKGYVFHDVPRQPHIFVSDNFTLKAVGGVVLAMETNVTVLYMHGGVVNNRWVPSDPYLQSRGVTVLGIIDDFERAQPNARVEVLYVCSGRISMGDSASRIRLFPSLDRVWVREGGAQGQGVRTIQKTTHTEMVVPNADAVNYLGWLANRSLK